MSTTIIFGLKEEIRLKAYNYHRLLYTGCPESMKYGIGKSRKIEYSIFFPCGRSVWGACFKCFTLPLIIRVLTSNTSRKLYKFQDIAICNIRKFTSVKSFKKFRYCRYCSVLVLLIQFIDWFDC